MSEHCESYHVTMVCHWYDVTAMQLEGCSMGCSLLCLRARKGIWQRKCLVNLQGHRFLRSCENEESRASQTELTASQARHCIRCCSRTALHKTSRTARASRKSASGNGDATAHKTRYIRNCKSSSADTNPVCFRPEPAVQCRHKEIPQNCRAPCIPRT